ncbi:MAG TPA: tail fiber protein [Acidobacteriaceae bacterium]|nr:tail fiber protein [Acidobacteriaceae bacterium]
MANPFLGEIRVFGFNFAPVGWALCNGEVLPISQNTALFSLLGTYYGGDGRTTFALPNLQGRFPINQGTGIGLSSRSIGETGGSATVALTVSELPVHTHLVNCVSKAGNVSSPAGAAFAETPGGKPDAYAPATWPKTKLSAAAVANTGGGQPHENRPPYLVLNFCIALQGVFPARS